MVSGSVGVALGRLRFDIEEGGMFRIKNQEYCVISNERKESAVLHVVSMR